jgi:hypothetical protein
LTGSQAVVAANKKNLPLEQQNCLKMDFLIVVQQHNDKVNKDEQYIYEENIGGNAMLPSFHSAISQGGRFV